MAENTALWPLMRTVVTARRFVPVMVIVSPALVIAGLKLVIPMFKGNTGAVEGVHAGPLMRNPVLLLVVAFAVLPLLPSSKR